MKQFDYIIKDPSGIDADPAVMLGKKAREFGGTSITVSKGENSALATKLMALIGLGAQCGDMVTVTVEGEQEDAAYKAIEEFMVENM